MDDDGKHGITVSAGIAAVGAGGVAALIGGSTFVISASAVGAGGTTVLSSLAAGTASTAYINIYGSVPDGSVVTGSSPGIDEWSTTFSWGAINTTIVLTHTVSTLFHYALE